jgi:hypothetical protein
MNNLEQCLKNTLFNKHSHTKLNFFQMAHSTKDRMLAHLSALQSLRGTGTQDAVFSQHLLIVKRWQSARLARTYADLAAQPRYAPAVDYFLNDLYAPKDFTKRDAEMIRIYPTPAQAAARIHRRNGGICPGTGCSF